MEQPAGEPFALMWQVDGGGLGEPGVAEALCSAVLAGPDSVAANRGVVVLVDRVQSRLRALAFRDGDDSRVTADDVLERVGDVVSTLSPSTTIVGPSLFRVLCSRFPVIPGGAQVTVVDQPVARVARGLGGNLADPALLDVLVKHTANTVDLPGCVGVVLLGNPAVPEILAVTFWSDVQSFERTERFFAEVQASVESSAGAAAGEVGIYEVLHIEPMARRVP